MCELSTNLVQWLDGELAEDDTAEIEQHLHSCRECRERAERYKNVSGVIRAYGDANLASLEPRRTMPTWAPVLGVAASLMLLLAIVVRGRVERSAGIQPTIAIASAPEALPQSIAPVAAARVATASVGAASALLSRPARVQVKHTQRKPIESTISGLRNANPDADWPAGPAIEIAIPGEAVFPPGAIPPGFGFVADVNIASDGSAQRMRLHPQLTGFGGGANQ
jgi:hypothetical protein